MKKNFLFFYPAFKIRLSKKPILEANMQKKNKNHFTPILGQASALTMVAGVIVILIVSISAFLIVRSRKKTPPPPPSPSEGQLPPPPEFGRASARIASTQEDVRRKSLLYGALKEMLKRLH